VRGVIRLEKALTPRDNGGAQTVNRARAGELW
jgi:hypothetical protein